MKLGKRLMSLVLALVMVLGLTIGASAATAQNIKVQLSPNITVKYNGEAQSMTDVNGNPVYPLLNDGTTYLPVRAVSNMLGVDVDWDGATQTVILTDPAGGRKPAASTSSTSTKPAPSTITVQLSPNITVKYNGKTQSMTDVNGTPVYPLLNGGTTYLPIRAVSNMLGVDVDWDGVTQTVLLSSTPAESSNSNKVTVTYTHTFENPTAKSIRMLLEFSGYPDYAINAAVAEFEAHGPNGKNGEFIYDVIVNKADTFKTSENAKTLGDKHVGCDYAEIDYSMADDGYVQVKLTKQVAKKVYCYVEAANAEEDEHPTYLLKLDKWVKIPLTNGTDKYRLTVKCTYSQKEYEALTPYEQMFMGNFQTAFDAKIEDPDNWMLLSNANVDFENAPKTVAKAAELTKNCKTDAEKITAIFEFVAKTIKPDYKLIDDEEKQWETDKVVVRILNLDDILTSKTGVCEHYAVLMAGMLRSQGIPCKVVSGFVYTGETVRGYYDKPGWSPHAWVAVSPDTKGLNLSKLGAGHDEDGWIRLDPTWGNTANGRSQASIDKNHQSNYAY